MRPTLAPESMPAFDVVLHTRLTLLSGQDVVMLYLAIGPLKKRKLRLKGHAVSFMVTLTIFVSIHRPYSTYMSLALFTAPWSL
jgi:hypothetical protein